MNIKIEERDLDMFYDVLENLDKECEVYKELKLFLIENFEKENNESDNIQ